MTNTLRPSPGLLRRLAAILYDTFLVLPLIMLLTALLMGISSVMGQNPDEQLLSPWIVRGLAVTCCTGFFVAFWLKGGQTLGMQAWRIKLVAQPGRQLTLGRGLLRCAAAALSAGCLGLGYLWCIFDTQGRSWHDHISGTELELLPGKKVKAGTSGAPQ